MNVEDQCIYACACISCGPVHTCLQHLETSRSGHTLLSEWSEGPGWNCDITSTFFPTCQVYHSCSPPPPQLAVLLLVLLVLLVLLLLQFLLDHVCTNFHLHFRLANSSPSSLPTSQLSVHRWTSIWDLPSSVCTAGPPRPIECQKICQIECQKICQIEYQKICQIEYQKICQ